MSEYDFLEDGPNHNQLARIEPAKTWVGRTLPHSADAEEYLLACCMMDAGLVTQAIAAGIGRWSFYDESRALIWARIADLRLRGQPTEVAVVAEDLKARRELDAAGGYSALSRISEVVPTTAQAAYFIQKIVEQQALRDTIRGATEIIERAHQYSGTTPAELEQFVTDIQRSLSGIGRSRPALPARQLSEFRVPARDDRSVLLGNRFLCRGDGGIIVSSSGVGKSSLYVLAAVLWALGRPFFGIRPNGPLSSLLIQSEDTDGDIAEVWASVVAGLMLTADEITEVGRRVRIVTDRLHRGQAFLGELRQQVAAHQPDIVWINPLVAFLDGDLKEARDTGQFLRDGLNGLNADARFAYILVHHTTKPPSDKGKAERNWSEVMYDMAGSYDLIGWARFIISLRPTEQQGEFNLVLAKRGTRAGVTRQVPQGAGFRDESVTTIPIRHDDQAIMVDGQPIRSLMWLPRIPVIRSEGEQSGGRPRTHTFSQFREIFPTVPEKAMTGAYLFKLAQQTQPGVSRTTFHRILVDAADDGLVQRVINGIGVKWFMR